MGKREELRLKEKVISTMSEYDAGWLLPKGRITRVDGISLNGELFRGSDGIIHNTKYYKKVKPKRKKVK